MEMAKVRFLKKGEEAVCPKWAGLLPAGWRVNYIEKHRPYRIEKEGELLTGILQTQREGALSAPWRENARRLLAALEKRGVGIVISPAEGELPKDILPLAEGRRLTNLFAFEGAAEALRRQGKNPAECRYLLAGGNEDAWRTALTSMGNEVNHLAIFTADPDAAKGLVQELFEERGLMTEVFSSPKNPMFGQADAVLCCGMEQRKYEHMLKEGAFWLDLAGNRPVLRRLLQARPDVFAVDGFFFKIGEGQAEGRFAEAQAFLSCDIFRENWQFPLSERAREEMLCELKEKGYTVSGFSVLGKRVKIRKKFSRHS